MAPTKDRFPSSHRFLTSCFTIRHPENLLDHATKDSNDRQLASEDGKTVRCPFCSAPYRKIIPHDAMQLKCDYCGATFVIPPKIGVDIPRCQNHPESRAAGKCNDCGGEFCEECLKTYNFTTRDGSALLYLCPNCLRKREGAKADSLILTGIGLALVGAVACFILLPIGILIIIGGVGIAVVGFSKKPNGDTTFEQEPEAGEPEQSAESDREEADRLYGDLFAKYSQHWGTATGAQLLEDEIRAYTWHGDTWPDAVRKVFRQNQKKT
jgi:uncharacterized Zn-finger protein